MLNRETQVVQGEPFSDDLKNGVGRFFFTASLGGTLGDFTARATLNHRGGYPLLGVPPQTRVSAFNTVDLFFSYNLDDLLPNTLLTLNIDNVLDEDPPFLNNAAGYTNGSTLGRLISFGIRTKF
ncbi:TonB-dependent receptor [Sphingopyxis sp. PET50]|uniref:TonB-dependent receptor n=1 Tax=Sphingopyxis sp. PET50 TaxID=2976533 RepID=UPI0021AF0C19|nr:TonB-dependent receptor [Sphingopyxis sp. PET50]